MFNVENVIFVQICFIKFEQTKFVDKIHQIRNILRVNLKIEKTLC